MTPAIASQATSSIGLRTSPPATSFPSSTPRHARANTPNSFGKSSPDILWPNWESSGNRPTRRASKPLRLVALEQNQMAQRHRFRHAGLAMPDTIQELTREIRAFRDARDWRQFHGPKELAVAIAAEAGELLQHFVWQSSEQSERRVRERRDQIASEIADVSILLLELSDNLGLDLAATIRSKLAHNEQRYPVEKARGSNRKYNEL